MVKAVEKAIREAGLGPNPQPDGNLIRVPIPELNEERSRELQKVAGKYDEQAKVAVRNVRRDGMDILKRMETRSEERRVGSKCERTDRDRGEAVTEEKNKMKKK